MSPGPRRMFLSFFSWNGAENSQSHSEHTGGRGSSREARPPPLQVCHEERPPAMLAAHWFFWNIWVLKLVFQPQADFWIPTPKKNIRSETSSLWLDDSNGWRFLFRRRESGNKTSL